MMQKLVFWLIYGFLWGVSKLPFWGLYLFSNVVNFILFKCIGYRKKVVWHNLKRALPQKTDKELKAIQKEFYKHFCDLFLEMVKTLSISKDELKRRFKILNPEEMQRLESLNKSIVIMVAHYCSYEWIIALFFYNMKYKPYGVYKKIKNPYFNKLIKDIRSRYNTTMLTTKETPKQMIDNKRKGVLAQYGMIADQSPKVKKSNYWLQFMGIETPVFVGSEVLAKRLDHSVTYLHIEKVKRGFYEAKFKTITTEPQSYNDYDITKEYFRFLEEQIKEKPAYYLWTHKRWKHKKTT